MAEITTRNAMHAAFSTAFGGPKWVFKPSFSLTPESENSRRRALDRLDGDLSPDKFVSSLTFDFWSNLFRREYESLWATPGLLTSTFPNLPSGEGRREVQARVALINGLRNRIAHHEPIYRRFNLISCHSAILELLALRCLATRDWTRRHSTVLAVVRAPPTRQSGLPGRQLSSANLRPPSFVLPEATITSALAALAVARPAVLLVGAQGRGPPFEAITAQRLLAFVQAGELDDMIDFSAHTVAEAVAATPSLFTATISRSATTGDLIALFFQRNIQPSLRPQVAIVMDETTPDVAGIVLRPEIRY
jgi:hypothetical protein